jgi:hypothetical protein
VRVEISAGGGVSSGSRVDEGVRLQGDSAHSLGLFEFNEEKKNEIREEKPLLQNSQTILEKKKD